jgi:hypothetical protein
MPTGLFLEEVAQRNGNIFGYFLIRQNFYISPKYAFSKQGLLQVFVVLKMDRCK